LSPVSPVSPAVLCFPGVKKSDSATKKPPGWRCGAAGWGLGQGLVGSSGRPLGQLDHIRPLAQLVQVVGPYLQHVVALFHMRGAAVGDLAFMG